MKHITQEQADTKEKMAVGAFLSAMHDQGLDGAEVRKAMLELLGLAQPATEPDMGNPISQSAPAIPPPHECKTEAERIAYSFGWWKALEYARGQVIDQPAVSGWKPIESAPKDGTEILLGHPDGSMCVGWWKAKGEHIGWTDGDTLNMWWPLYWQPRPPAPTGEPG